MSVQCAQNSISTTQIHKSNNPLQEIKGDSIIDLTSPITTRGTETTWVHAKTCYAPLNYTSKNTPLSSAYEHKKVHPKAILIGKRLFEDNHNYLEEQERSKGDVSGSRQIPRLGTSGFV